MAQGLPGVVYQSVVRQDGSGEVPVENVTVNWIEPSSSSSISRPNAVIRPLPGGPTVAI